MAPDPDANADPNSPPDPTVIRSLAVAAEDVVDAFVYTRENPGTAVLRATPPFHGRMRARLHVYRVADDRVTGAVHVSPAALLEDDVVRAYPTPDSIAGERSEGDDPAAVREERAAALEAWREQARSALVETVSIDAGTDERSGDDGAEADEHGHERDRGDRQVGHEVSVTRLG